MANQKQVQLLEQGAEQWNRWRKEHPETQPDLSHATLNSITLRGADLSGADLSGAFLIDAELQLTNLSTADLRGASLNLANLNSAHLSNALLNGANLDRTILNYADLRGADLSYARLKGTALYQTEFSGAKLLNTSFLDIDFRTVNGLAEIQHVGPSIVGLYGIHLPQDGSALHFLRGCGVPDEWIDLYRTQTMHSIHYHSCFISYSSKDETLARRLHADLQARGVRCWFAPEDMKIGNKIRDRIDEAIHLQDKLLLLLSEHSIASTWVENEVEAALEKEDRQQREVLFPVRLDDAVMQTTRAWAATLRRTRHIGDFTQWTEPEAYQQAFERLLKDLKRANGSRNRR